MNVDDAMNVGDDVNVGGAVNVDDAVNRHVVDVVNVGEAVTERECCGDRWRSCERWRHTGRRSFSSLAVGDAVLVNIRDTVTTAPCLAPTKHKKFCFVFSLCHCDQGRGHCVHLLEGGLQHSG